MDGWGNHACKLLLHPNQKVGDFGAFAAENYGGIGKKITKLTLVKSQRDSCGVEGKKSDYLQNWIQDEKHYAW
ncbi:hypothetical protein V6N13_106103 [Hibiscus sabdariffa]